jgi:hypothetical protein
MEVVAANKLARDIARYIRDHPKPVELSRRVKHITHGENLDNADIRQVTRKVRRILFGDRKWGPQHEAADRAASPRTR